ncbi:MAG TPA: glycoside hydrolase family 38 C-terminal domain-containing protein, partial [Anaerolineae bacterium]
MALTEGWKRRLDGWQKAIIASVYRPLGVVAVEGFTTTEQLTPQQALTHEFRPMPAGTAWGAKWEYGWFKTAITLPDDAAGKRIVFATYDVYNPFIDRGDTVEAIVWLNGAEVGALDFGHKEITLSEHGVPGTHYEILMEVYAGHGVRNEGGGPQLYGVESVPEPGPTQTHVSGYTFGEWREDVFQLGLDFITLMTLRDAIDQNSLRVAEIDRGLMDASLVIDMELPEAAMLASARAGRERLKPLLEKVNGSTTPTLHAFGHGHLDIEFLWPLAETVRKMARTISTQLTLAAEYPEYKFLQSQPYLMQMLKTNYPNLYERFKAAVKTGNIIIDGGMWVEADTNITGGESLIRQFIHGKRFMREEYGVESRNLWLPDVFGYSGALPQIMAGCGVTGLMTHKVFWFYNGGDPFPYNNFQWEGIDGSSVLAHLFKGYGHLPIASDLVETWNKRNQRNDINAMVHPIGWGDGGGGASRAHIELALRAANLEGAPRVRMSSPNEYFDDLRAHEPVKNRYVGELYFQAHRGTYTSQAKTKKGNRRCELELRETEMWGTAAHALRGYNFSAATLDADWKVVLLHQFHDGLPGSSIQRVYEEIEQAHAAVIAKAQSLTQAALTQLVNPAPQAAIFNSLSWLRHVLVPLPEGIPFDGVTQNADNQMVVEVSVPACGWADLSHAVRPSGGLKATSRSFENEHLRTEFNELGEITSLVDKASGREITAGPCNVFKMYKDVPSWFDAWDIDPMYVDCPVELAKEASLTLQANGPLVAELRLMRTLTDTSTLTQIIRLRHDSRRIDFETTVHWQENHKLLKVAFPVNIHSDEAIHEIQFGYVRRPNHYSRPFDADRFEVSNHKWSALAEADRGVAILNDCKYGLNVLGNTINLTLLKASVAPDMNADKGIQTFTYALYPWNGSLLESGVVREAYDLNVPAVVVKGGISSAASLFSVDQDNIIIETVKPAEDDRSKIIVRLYEAMHKSTTCRLKTSLPVRSASQTDMLE